MSKAPDQALRRLVANLADLRPADVEAILAELEPAHRGRVRALLADLGGAATVTAAVVPPSVEEVWSPALAPWLLERLGEAPEDAALSLRAQRVSMTDVAQAALTGAALAAGARIVAPKPQAQLPHSPATGLERLAGLFRRGAR